MGFGDSCTTFVGVVGICVGLIPAPTFIGIGAETPTCFGETLIGDTEVCGVDGGVDNGIDGGINGEVEGFIGAGDAPGMTLIGGLNAGDAGVVTNDGGCMSDDGDDGDVNGDIVGFGTEAVSGGAAGVGGFCVKSIGGIFWGGVGAVGVGVGDGVFCIDAGLGTDDGDGAVIVEAGTPPIVEGIEGIEGVGGFGGKICCDVGDCDELTGGDETVDCDETIDGAGAFNGFDTAETTCSETPDITGFSGVGADELDAGGWAGVPVMDVT